MHVRVLRRGQGCIIPLQQRPLGAHCAELAKDSTWPVKDGVIYRADNKCKEELRKSEKLSLGTFPLSTFLLFSSPLSLKIK